MRARRRAGALVDPGLLRDENREVSPPDAVLGQCELQEPLNEDEARIIDHLQAAKETYEKFPHVADKEAQRFAELSRDWSARSRCAPSTGPCVQLPLVQEGVLGASGRRRRPSLQRRLKGRCRLAAPS